LAGKTVRVVTEIIALYRKAEQKKAGEARRSVKPPIDEAKINFGVGYNLI